MPDRRSRIRTPRAYAGETPQQILRRKIRDIALFSRDPRLRAQIPGVPWRLQSSAVTPDRLRRLFGHEPAYVIFVGSPGARDPHPGSGQRRGLRTAHGQRVQWQDPSSGSWKNVPRPLQVGSYGRALLLLALERPEKPRVIDLGLYRNAPGTGPIKFSNFCSTQCGTRTNRPHPGAMKSSVREVVAVGRIVRPHSVELRAG
ncbi:MAG TPA: hypothetical protein PLU30_23420 [Verrucomicrobiae bacterium]|nr:hypothetical protein [Verrucomicrobiae bacterium]